MSPAEAIRNASIMAVNVGHWWGRCGRSIIRIGKWASVFGAIFALGNGGIGAIGSGLRAVNAMPATEAYVQEQMKPVVDELHAVHGDVVILRADLGRVSSPVPTEVAAQLARIEGLLLDLQKKPVANTPTKPNINYTPLRRQP